MSNEHVVLEIPNPLWRVAGNCAVYCEPSCCGVGAYELLPQHLKPWAVTALPEDVALVLRQADELLAQMGRIGPDAHFEWINYDGPNWHRYWLEDLRECIVEATSPPRTRPDGTPFVREVTAEVRVLNRHRWVDGTWFRPQPLTGPSVYVIAPERPVWADISLSASAVPPGKLAIAHLKFPLPARVQPVLFEGASLDLTLHGESKMFEATILALE